MFQSLLPSCSTVWADINTKMRMTSSYVWPNHHKWHDINSARQLYLFIYFSWAVLHSALVCGSVPLLSGPPDSPLTVRQRSRKMAVIHFVPRHRQRLLFFFSSLLAHYLQTRLCVSAGHCSLPLWPRPMPYSRGLRLVDDPLQILSVPPASIRVTPLYLQEKKQQKKKDGRLGKQWLVSLSSSKMN